MNLERESERERERESERALFPTNWSELSRMCPGGKECLVASCNYSLPLFITTRERARERESERERERERELPLFRTFSDSDVNPFEGCCVRRSNTENFDSSVVATSLFIGISLRSNSILHTCNGGGNRHLGHGWSRFQAFSSRKTCPQGTGGGGGGRP